MDTTKVIIDSLAAKQFLEVNWTDNVQNYVVYILVGLFFTWFYFWQNLKKDESFPDNWKEFFTVPQYQRIFWTHIVFYFSMILGWLTMGGKILVFIPVELIRLSLSIINMPFGAAENIYQAFDIVMPKGHLTLFTAFWGFFGTSIIRNWLPALFKWLQSKFVKKEDHGFENKIESKKEVVPEIKKEEPIKEQLKG